MNDFTFRYSIRSQLPGRLESATELGSNFVNTLDALTRIDPSVFTNWEVMDFPAKASVPLAAARLRIGIMIENNVSRDDLGEPDPYYGYGAVAFTGHVIKSRHVNLRIKAGGTITGDTWLETGYLNVPVDPAIITYPLFKATMITINRNWPPPWACANAFRMNYGEAPLFSGAPLFPYSRFHIPWFAYLSEPLAAGLGSRLTDIITERMPDGGLLITVTEDRLDPTNLDHVRRARILAETMIARTGHSS
jgi:hypothetical protein